MSTQNVRIEQLGDDMVDETIHLLNTIMSSKQSTQFYRRVIRQNPTLQLAAVLKQKVIGALICRKSEDRVEIIALAVKAVYRHQGIGSSLIQILFHRVTQLDVTIIDLYIHATNNDTLRFYQSVGFKEMELIDKYYREKDSSAVHMIYETKR
ncbi:hypothetical protein WA171_002375, partial [Blastocystis sp. BT1]